MSTKRISFEENEDAKESLLFELRSYRDALEMAKELEISEDNDMTIHQLNEDISFIERLINKVSRSETIELDEEDCEKFMEVFHQNEKIDEHPSRGVEMIAQEINS